MGLFDFLSSNKRLMIYEINMNEENAVYVNVKKETAGLTDYEYLRLWAHYHCKIMYNLGYPKNETAEISCLLLNKIVAKPFDTVVDCFKLAELDDIMRYSKQPIKPIVSFTGEFFSKESSSRFIKTYFPYSITEQQVLYSSIGLLQYVLDICSNNQNNLDVAWKQIFFILVALYNPESIKSAAALTLGVPEIAFSKALGIDINEILSETSESKDDTSERFLTTYQEVSNGNSLSDTAISYCVKHYPLDSGATHNSFLGGFFKVGYNIRVTEESFADEFNFNINEIMPNSVTHNIIHSWMSKEDKISSIAEYKEENNTSCNLGPEVEDYSILGLDVINQYFSYLLMDYIEAIGFAKKYESTQDIAVELSGRNAALGYCFRLAEGIIDSHYSNQ
ncbi:MAG: hypothetical protein ACOX7N_10965 [Lawsonibacter sp.]